MSEPLGCPLLDLAVAKGIVSRQAAEEARIEAAANGDDVLQVLVNRGLIVGHAAKVLREELSEREQIPTSIGNYRIVSLLGSGNMGVVYKAKQSSLHDRLVAIKVLSPLLNNDARFVERFHREALALAKISDPHVMHILDVGCENRLHYMVMEYLDGGDAERLRQHHNGRLPLERAVQIIIDALKGLSALHERNLIHRDIKPQNILLTTSGVAKIADLGLSRSQMGDHAILTEPGTIVGTPAYMAPEQALGEREQDIRVDIYSTGASLYTLTTGLVPFQQDHLTASHISAATSQKAFSSDDIRSVIAQVISGPFPDPRTDVPGFPDGLAKIISKATATHREDRYQLPEEFLADLTSFQLQPHSFSVSSFSPQPAESWIETTVDLPAKIPAAAAHDKSNLPLSRAWWLVTSAAVLLLFSGILWWSFTPKPTIMSSVPPLRGSSPVSDPAPAPGSPTTAIMTSSDRTSTPSVDTHVVQNPVGSESTPPDPQITALQIEQEQWATLNAQMSACTASTSPTIVASLSTAITAYQRQAIDRLRADALANTWLLQQTLWALSQEERVIRDRQQFTTATLDAYDKALSSDRYIQALLIGHAFPFGIITPHLHRAWTAAIPHLHHRRMLHIFQEAVDRGDVAAAYAALASALQGPIGMPMDAGMAERIRATAIPAFAHAVETAHAQDASYWLDIAIQAGLDDAQQRAWTKQLTLAQQAARVVEQLTEAGGDMKTADPTRLERALHNWPAALRLEPCPLARQARARLLAEQLRRAEMSRPKSLRLVHNNRDYQTSGSIILMDGTANQLGHQGWTKKGVVMDPEPAKQFFRDQWQKTVENFEHYNLTLNSLRESIAALDQEGWYHQVENSTSKDTSIIK